MRLMVFSKRVILFNVNNVADNFHNEIIGGPKLGRHITLKLTARF